MNDKLMSDPNDMHGMGDSHLIFVFNALMHPEQIAACCKEPRLVTVARLPDYRLGFFGHSMRWEGGNASVVPWPGAEAWGVVYALSPLDAQRLDLMYAVREDGSGLHFHMPGEVFDPRDGRHDVVFHLRNSLGEERPPSTEHLRILVEGARRRGLSTDYLHGLETLPSQPTSIAVPRFSHLDPLAITQFGCESCV